MKRCCHYNAKWINDPDTNIQSVSRANKSRLVLDDFAKDHTGCAVIYFWYDADYENMMFDLRSMNTFCDPVDTSWMPIETAPTDGTVVECYAPGAIHALHDLIGPCAYHPDAGWCMDEIREITLWRPKQS